MTTSSGAVALTTFSEWVLTTRQQQEATLDATIDAWTQHPWPDGLVSHTCLAAEDGRTLRHHSEWTGAAAWEAFQRAGSGPRLAAIELAAGGPFERRDLATYVPARAWRRDEPGDAAVGCVVIVDVALERPDAGAQRAWADALGEALAAGPPAGLVAAVTHLGTDGDRMAIYAGWTSAGDHLAALRDGEGWSGAGGAPGVAASRVTRSRRFRVASDPLSPVPPAAM